MYVVIVLIPKKNFASFIFKGITIVICVRRVMNKVILRQKKYKFRIIIICRIDENRAQTEVVNHIEILGSSTCESLPVWSL